MAIFGLLIALLLPGLLGVVWLRRLWGAAAGGWPLVLGYGYPLGVLITTLVMRGVDAVGWPLNFVGLAVLLAALAGLGAWLTRGLSWRVREGGSAAPEWQAQATWQKGLFGLLSVLLLARLAGSAAEILWLPLYPWDAWTTWGVRARVWFELKHLVPFIDPSGWLADTTGSSYTIGAWQYPPMISLVQVWMALGLGRWNESLINLPWLLCAVALGLGFYGQARLWGISPWQSLLFTWLLFSLPMMDTHIALAGYADLWLATAFGLAAIAFFQWLRTRDRRQGWLALLLALVCPFVKAEGTVWLLAFVPGLLAARLGFKRLLWMTGAFGLAVAVWWMAGGFSMPVPGLGTVTFTPERIDIPYLGRFVLGFYPNWSAFIQNFLVLDNWHLLWYLALVLIPLALPGIITDRVLLLCSTVVLTLFLLLFFLFFMTAAQAWARYYTSLNRVFLQTTPMVLFYLLIVFNALAARKFGKEPASVPQPG